MKKLFTIIIIILVCLIILFLGYYVYVNLGLYTSIPETTLQEVLVLTMIVASATIFFLSKRQNLRMPQKPVPLIQNQNPQKQAKTQTPELPLEEPTTEEILCDPIGDEQPSQQTQKPSEETRSPIVDKESLEKELECAKIELKIAVYHRLKDDVRNKEIDVEPALDLLTDNGPKEAPAILKNKKEEKAERVDLPAEPAQAEESEEKPLT